MSIHVIQCANCSKHYVAYALYTDDGRLLAYPPCSSCGKPYVKEEDRP